MKLDSDSPVQVSETNKFKWGHIVGHKKCPAWKRWVIPIPLIGWSIRVHKFTPNHRDADPHSHPWWFLTIVLKGSYIDEHSTSFLGEVLEVNDVLRRGSIRFRRANHVHRVNIGASGCTTVIITGKHRGNWGFYTPEGYMSAAKYRVSKWIETVCDR